MNDTLQHILTTLAIWIISVPVIWLCSVVSLDFYYLPIFSLVSILIFAIQWIVFLPSFIFKTENFFDLTGSITYLLSIWCSILFKYKTATAVDYTMGGMVTIWGARLGYFLITRAIQAGGDARFTEIKQSFTHFFMVWNIQALWVLMTLMAAMAAITSPYPSEFGVWAGIGTGIWVLGFAIEAIADWQKTAFRKDTSNQGRFIQSGLWKFSRHPNYFGEIVLWTGISIMAVPSLGAWTYFTLISPAFVAVLLIFVSGIPILERRSAEKWGEEAQYKNYVKETAVLIPGIHW